ncbi:type VI secretion system tip protein VgrG [Spirosoma areae]
MNPTSSTAPPATDNVTVSILIDGTNVSQQVGGVLSLSVYREFNKIPTARLLFEDAAQGTNPFPKSNSPQFVPGKRIDIQVGYRSQEESIFQGIIVRHGVKIRPGKPSVLDIECKDVAVKTTLIRHSRYFYDKTDAEIVRQLIGNYTNLTVGDLPTTQPQHPELVQHHCTDWDFLVMRADANGLLVAVQNGQVKLVRPQVASRATHTATNGSNVIELETEMDARTHWPAVEANTWDYTQQQLSQEDAQAAGGSNADFSSVLYGSDKVALFHGGDMASEQLRAWATAQQTKSDLSRRRGRVRMRGLPVVPGDTLELAHTGDRYDGRYWVSGVMHQVFGGTWQTDIQLGMSTQEYADTSRSVQTPAAAGLFPGVRGLHVGVVSNIEGDTREGNHRIQVRIPYLAVQESGQSGQSGQQAEGIWARLSTLYAGASRGFVFRPEVGDEVILGFINDDPNDAIILGAVHSNQRAAPFDPSNDNFQKGIVTKEGMRVVFNEQEKSLLINTKEDDSGFSILLSQQGEKIEIRHKAGHSILLNSDGITLDSAKNISLKASSGFVKIEGTKIDLN